MGKVQSINKKALLIDCLKRSNQVEFSVRESAS